MPDYDRTALRCARCVGEIGRVQVRGRKGGLYCSEACADESDYEAGVSPETLSAPQPQGDREHKPWCDLLNKTNGVYSCNCTQGDRATLAQGCARSHPHENMSTACRLQTDVARDRAALKKIAEMYTPLGVWELAGGQYAYEMQKIARLALSAPAEATEPRFAFDVFWSDEDEAFIAALRRPEHWLLSGAGDTKSEAVRELAVAIGLAYEVEEDREPRTWGISIDPTIRPLKPFNGWYPEEAQKLYEPTRLRRIRGRRGIPEK